MKKRETLCITICNDYCVIVLRKALIILETVKVKGVQGLGFSGSKGKVSELYLTG